MLERGQVQQTEGGGCSVTGLIDLKLENCSNRFSLIADCHTLIHGRARAIFPRGANLLLLFLN